MENDGCMERTAKLSSTVEESHNAQPSCTAAAKPQSHNYPCSFLPVFILLRWQVVLLFSPKCKNRELTEPSFLVFTTFSDVFMLANLYAETHCARTNNVDQHLHADFRPFFICTITGNYYLHS